MMRITWHVCGHNLEEGDMGKPMLLPVFFNASPCLFYPERELELEDVNYDVDKMPKCGTPIYIGSLTSPHWN